MSEPSLVRPYALTRGRTRPARQYPVEALVTAAPGIAAERGTTPEERSLLTVAGTAHSVAELAALVGLPLGVVRVLLSDLAERGLVTAHASHSDRPDAALLQRVLGGLRRL
ncbi:MAG: DUF742 domain-containing protein [Nocardioides sp.]|uniref:DUF742 domain-containing protein n=1 Tax=Nocardioides sp. TaxID=35761 RepID=UPI0039E5FEE9